MQKHYAARQIGSGRWAWTVDEGGQISTAGPCVLHGDGHLTKEQAERHFYDFDIQTLTEVAEKHPNKSHDCHIPWCGVFTSRGLATRHSTEPMWLCSEHRFRHIYTMLRPFEPGIEVKR